MNQVSIPHSKKQSHVQLRSVARTPPSTPQPATHTSSDNQPPAAVTNVSQDRLAVVLARVGEIANRVNAIANQRSADLLELQKLAVHLAVTVAEQVLDKEFAAGSQEINKLVAKAFDEHRHVTPLEVHLHPEDAGALDLAIPGVAITQDATMERGDCRVEFDAYTIERRWREQLERIRTALVVEAEDANSES